VIDNLSNEEIQTKIDKAFQEEITFVNFDTKKNSYNMIPLHPSQKNYFGGTRKRARRSSRRRRGRGRTRARRT
jgi:hypothetical protein